MQIVIIDDTLGSTMAGAPETIMKIMHEKAAFDN